VETAGLPETVSDRRYRHAACLLADIGWRASPDYRGEQSFNLIANAGFVAIDHAGRAYLGLSVFFRHEGLQPEKASPKLREIAGEHLFQRARLLAGLMRVAYPVSVAMAGVLPRVPLVMRNGAIVLELPRELAALASDRLTARLKQLARLLDVEARVDVVG
ncbi:MAG: exopolyphosphatase, partial [Microvirga sp.]